MHTRCLVFCLGLGQTFGKCKMFHPKSPDLRIPDLNLDKASLLAMTTDGNHTFAPPISPTFGAYVSAIRKQRETIAQHPKRTNSFYPTAGLCQSVSKASPMPLAGPTCNSQPAHSVCQFQAA